MPFSLNSRGTGGARLRRRSALVRRVAIAVCCGCAVWFALQCVIATVATQTVVVAAKDIARGDVIAANAVATRTVPSSEVMNHAAGMPNEVVGAIAQLDIDAGSPVLSGMTAAAPVAGPGRTTMEIALSSVPESLAAGDDVRLVTTSDGGNGDGKHDGNDDDGTARILARHATVLRTPRNHEESDGLLSSSDGESMTVTFALTPDEALAVLTVRDHGPILAVVV